MHVAHIFRICTQAEFVLGHKICEYFTFHAGFDALCKGALFFLCNYSLTSAKHNRKCSVKTPLQNDLLTLSMIIPYFTKLMKGRRRV